MKNHVIIIGAGRSGTNMLRDILSQLPGVGTWPCDEINYIWRHGNVTFPTDELKPEHATAHVRRFIQQKFQHLAGQYNLQYVVEKTCANSLRVGFVDEVVPDAKYLFIVRDGRDVIASALKRWQAPLDTKYIAAKARYVPVNDIPYYGFRYLGNHFHRLISQEKRLAFWGPRFEGMDELLRRETLPIVCAHQWRRCVERAEEDFRGMDSSRVLQLQYEHLVNDSATTLGRIFDFLQIDVDQGKTRQLGQNIRPDSVGKWQQDLSAEVIDEICPVIHDLQKKYSYV